MPLQETGESQQNPEIALLVDNLQYKIGFTSIIRDIRFQLNRGEMLALLGPNGAGKSTLLKCLAGLLPCSGDRKIFGTSLKRNYQIKQKIGYLGHETFLYLKLSARENLLFYASLYGNHVDVDSLLQQFSLFDFGEQLVETFSRGMKQRLSLARALMSDPALLLLDEPFTGLDQQAREFLEQKLDELRNRTTIILSTHEFERGINLCDKLLILKNGRQVFFGSEEQITGSIQQFYAQTVK